jgi:hypothetical protein
MEDDKKIPDFLVQLIIGCSTSFKTANNFWIALVTFSVIAISPTKTNDGKYTLPINLGSFQESDFYPLVFTIISLIIICYGSVFAQALRSSKLVYRAVTDLKNSHVFIGNIHIQDVVDAMIYPTINRVAPIAQLLQGKDQFFPEANNRSKIKSFVSFSYYAILKLVTILVRLIFPAYALIVSFIRSKYFSNSVWQIPSIFFVIIGLFALIIIIQLVLYDIVHIWRIYKRLVFNLIF